MIYFQKIVQVLLTSCKLTLRVRESALRKVYHRSKISRIRLYVFNIIEKLLVILRKHFRWRVAARKFFTRYEITFE